MKIQAVGDTVFQEKCKKCMQEMILGGTALLFVSHSIEQVKALCQRVLWIDKGIVKAYEKTEDIISLYAG